MRVNYHQSPAGTRIALQKEGILPVLHDLVDYCDQLLDVAAFQDYCPNGLQVEGRSEVHRIISGVTASQALIKAAAKLTNTTDLSNNSLKVIADHIRACAFLIADGVFFL